MEYEIDWGEIWTAMIATFDFNYGVDLIQT